jgi:hypothetical protein
MISKPKNKRVAIIVAVIIVIGVIALILLRGNEDTWIKDGSGKWVMHGNPTIRDFDSCAKKYPVRETYPEQCAMPNGPTFTKDVL